MTVHNLLVPVTIYIHTYMPPECELWPLLVLLLELDQISSAVHTQTEGAAPALYIEDKEPITGPRMYCLTPAAASSISRIAIRAFRRVIQVGMSVTKYIIPDDVRSLL